MRNPKNGPLGEVFEEKKLIHNFLVTKEITQLSTKLVLH